MRTLRLTPPSRRVQHVRYSPSTSRLTRPPRLSGFYEVPLVPLPEPRLLGVAAAQGQEDPALSVEGIDVPRSLRSLGRLVGTKRYRVKLQFRTVGGDRVTDLELSLGRPVHRWSVRVPLQRFKSDPPAAEADKFLADEYLYDRALLHLIHYLYFNESGPRWTSDTAGAAPSEESMAHYRIAYRLLGDYLSTRQKGPLDAAIRELQLLRAIDSKHRDGLLLLGVAFSEARRELEAIMAFEQVSKLISQTATPDDQLTLWKARLMKGVSLRKLYTWQGNHRSINELEALDQELAKQKDDDEVTRLRANALLELASAYGQYFTSELQQDLKQMVTAADAPASIKKMSPTDFGVALEEIWKMHEAQIKAYDALKTKLEALLKTDELSDLGSRRLNAHGYARYLRARLTSYPTAAAYQTECQAAVELMEQAILSQPDAYQALQNLGRALLDRRFDPSGKQIDRARQLYSRSVELKPDDYWGHEQLAVAALRAVEVEGVLPSLKSKIDGGIVAGEKSKTLRNDSSSARLTLSELYAARYLIDSEEKSRTAAGAEGTGNLENARELGGDSSWSDWVEALWLAVRFISASHEAAKFDAERKEVLKVVSDVLTKVAKRSGPELEHYVSALSRLQRELKKATSANYKELRVY